MINGTYDVPSQYSHSSSSNQTIQSNEMVERLQSKVTNAERAKSRENTRVPTLVNHPDFRKSPNFDQQPQAFNEMLSSSWRRPCISAAKASSSTSPSSSVVSSTQKACQRVGVVGVRFAASTAKGKGSMPDRAGKRQFSLQQINMTLTTNFKDFEMSITPRTRRRK